MSAEFHPVKVPECRKLHGENAAPRWIREFAAAVAPRREGHRKRPSVQADPRRRWGPV